MKSHLIGVALFVAIVAAYALPAAVTWEPVPAENLHVTSGTITMLASGLLDTRSPEMRAVELDRGRHARSALLQFRYRQPSDGTSYLGSGAFRRQMGLELQAGDPCNLLYVMWWEYPVHQIAISVKRNPGQHTSAECGNQGYTGIAKIPLAIPSSVVDIHKHLLEAHTRREPDNSITLTVIADGKTVYDKNLGASLTADIVGPIGIRSDNGNYRFNLFAAERLAYAPPWPVFAGPKQIANGSLVHPVVVARISSALRDAGKKPPYRATVDGKPLAAGRFWPPGKYTRQISGQLRAGHNVDVEHVITIRTRRTS